MTIASVRHSSFFLKEYLLQVPNFRNSSPKINSYNLKETRFPTFVQQNVRFHLNYSTAIVYQPHFADILIFNPNKNYRFPPMTLYFVCYCYPNWFEYLYNFEAAVLGANLFTI